MRVVLIEAFYADSHRQWADGLARYSSHSVEILHLPGKYWKWRMHGAAVIMAQQVDALSYTPDLFIVTDMMDIATWRGLIAQRYRQVPCLLYMHENQLTYPWSPTDKDHDLERDRHYAWINFTSMLSADHVCFNSNYHRSSVLAALPTYLAAYPDHRCLNRVAEISDQSSVLHLGMQWSDVVASRSPSAIPTLLWNHRWEYDKGPQAWLDLVDQLAEDYSFGLIICGKSYARYPSAFDDLRHRHQDKILHWGYAETQASYQDLLLRADIMPVTSTQDFFGISVVEAIRYGVMPILPHRLAYPDYIDPELHLDLYYEHDPYPIMARVLDDWPQSYRDLRSAVEHLHWPSMIAAYDSLMTALVDRCVSS